MNCIAIGAELLIQDFCVYCAQFPFKDPSCLLRCSPHMIQNMKTMHAEDEHDDKLVAEEMALGVHTRAQIRATEAARAADIAIAADVQSVLPVISEEAETLQNEDNDNDDSSPETTRRGPGRGHFTTHSLLLKNMGGHLGRK